MYVWFMHTVYLGFLSFFIAVNLSGFGKYFNYIFTNSFHFMALTSFIAGILGYKLWNAPNSCIGRSLVLLSIGLFLQFLGHTAYVLPYIIYNIESSYPSIGDLCFFAGVFVNMLSILYLAKGVLHPELPKLFSPTAVLSLFLLVACISLTVLSFFYTNNLTSSASSHIFLEIVYPLVQIGTLVTTILIMYLSQDILDGFIFKAVAVLFVSLFVAFVADQLFVYQFYSETWEPGGASDFLYLTAYYLEGVALLGLSSRFYRKQRFTYIIADSI